MNRRNFLKTLGVGAGTVACARSASASSSVKRGESVETNAILVDTTKCVGCRSCEEACATENKLPEPDLNDEKVFDQLRDTSYGQFTVVNRFAVEEGKEPVFAKKQCMHCLDPACASACLTRGMHKSPEGPVVWRGEKCMGCRYCMVSCPFDVPKFEYHSNNPRISKCQMCLTRTQAGKLPACVENCGGDALTFGKRSDLLHEAKQRIYGNPGKYVQHIYGEHEAGGTGVLYLAAVPFEKLAFNTRVEHGSYPAMTKGFMDADPVVLALWPTFMLALHEAYKRRDDVHDSEHGPTSATPTPTSADTHASEASHGKHNDH